MANADFTARTLMAMREDVASLVETAGRLQAVFGALAAEHQITPVRETETSRTRNNLKTSIDNSISWRSERVEIHPGDSRNRDAVRHLTALLRSCDDLSTGKIEAYQKAYDEFSYVSSSIESSMLRRVGFDYFPKSADEFVSELVSKVSGPAE